MGSSGATGIRKGKNSNSFYENRKAGTDPFSQMQKRQADKASAAASAEAAAQAPAPAQHSGLYDPKTTSNFEEEIKKRRKNPTGGAMGGTGGYGGNTKLG
jgi:hypothetical protein